MDPPWLAGSKECRARHGNIVAVEGGDMGDIRAASGASRINALNAKMRMYYLDVIFS